MTNRKSWVAVGIFLAALATGGAPHAMESKPILTLEMAKKMADACETLQNTQGFRPVIIAIHDDGGNVKLFRRQENAFLGSILVATMKATTSSSFPFPSSLTLYKYR